MSEFWTGLWTLLLSTGLFLFAALAVIVSISGLIQLRKLVRAGSHKASPTPKPPTPAEESPPSDAQDASDTDAVT